MNTLADWISLDQSYRFYRRAQYMPRNIHIWSSHTCVKQYIDDRYICHAQSHYWRYR